MEFVESVEIAKLRTIPGVKNVALLGINQYKIEAQGGQDIRPAISQFVKQQNITLLSMNKMEHGLEEVFRKLTKK